MTSLYVSPIGNDSNAGTKEAPLATMSGARDALRRLRGGMPSSESYEVIFAPGEYCVNETIRFDMRDSGVGDGRIVYRAQQHRTVRFYGGKRLKGFAPVSDKTILAKLPSEAWGRVLQCDLHANDVDNLGDQLPAYGDFFTPRPWIDVYCNGRRMHLARWPKNEYLRPKSLIEPGELYGKSSILEYDASRHERWQNAEEPWLFGYFRYLWADGTVKIAKIDPQTHTITTDWSYCGGPLGSMDSTGGLPNGGIKYYAFNLLEELSEPGEFFISRKNKMLYFIPPSGVVLDELQVEIAMFDKPVIELYGVSNLAFRDIDFDMARFNAMTLERCDACAVTGCRLTRFGGDAISISGSTNCRIADCELAWLDRGGIIAKGGERETLTHGNLVIENNRIHHFGCVNNTYVPAVDIAGCGNRIAHNLIYHAPSTAIHVSGNEQIIEYNEVHSVVMESDDQGAIDIYGCPSYRGNIFRYNWFHDIGKRKKSLAAAGVNGIRLDDAICGQEVYGNIFERASEGNFGGVQINCGRDNRIHDNLFLDCHYGISTGYCPFNCVWDDLRAGRKKPEHIRNDLYFTRYPELKNVLDPNGKNDLHDNLFAGCGSVFFSALVWENLYDCQNNHEVREIGLNVNQALAMGEERFGFKKIPICEIGAHWHDGCAWDADASSIAEDRPLDWHEMAVMPQIAGEASFDAQWQIFRCAKHDEFVPSTQDLMALPQRLVIDGCQIEATSVNIPDGALNFNDYFQEVGEGRIFWVYSKLTVAQSGKISIGCAFDWWGDVWLDGKKIFTTGTAGNGDTPMNAIAHVFTVDITAGEHWGVSRLKTGRYSGSMALAAGDALRKIAKDALWWK